MLYNIFLIIHLLAVAVGLALAVRLVFWNDSIRWSLISLALVVASGIGLLIIQPSASVLVYCKMGLLMIMLGYAGVALQRGMMVNRLARVSLLTGWIGVIIASVVV